MRFIAAEGRFQSGDFDTHFLEKLDLGDDENRFSPDRLAAVEEHLEALVNSYL